MLRRLMPPAADDTPITFDAYLPPVAEYRRSPLFAMIAFSLLASLFRRLR